MKLIIINGKNSKEIGENLSRITGYSHFHNTYTLEPFLEFCGTYDNQINRIFNAIIFEEFSIYQAKVLIFTTLGYSSRTVNYMLFKKLEEMVEQFGVSCHYVELISSNNFSKVVPSSDLEDDSSLLENFQDLPQYFSQLQTKIVLNFENQLKLSAEPFYNEKYIRAFDNSIIIDEFVEKIREIMCL